uniref:Putative mucin related 2b n=1 Tax=Corethrella appendiculata TaxID=1370023 RepID=U5EMQ0_9DIPT
MPRIVRKKETPTPVVEEDIPTLTASRSRRTIKPNRKYLDDNLIVSSSRASSPSIKDEDSENDEVVTSKKQSVESAIAKKKVIHAPKSEPVKNLRRTMTATTKVPVTSTPTPIVSTVKVPATVGTRTTRNASTTSAATTFKIDPKFQIQEAVIALVPLKRKLDLDDSDIKLSNAVSKKPKGRPRIIKPTVEETVDFDDEPADPEELHESKDDDDDSFTIDVSDDSTDDDEDVNIKPVTTRSTRSSGSKPQSNEKPVTKVPATKVQAQTKSSSIEKKKVPTTKSSGSDSDLDVSPKVTRLSASSLTKKVESNAAIKKPTIIRSAPQATTSTVRITPPASKNMSATTKIISATSKTAPSSIKVIEKQSAKDNKTIAETKKIAPTFSTKISPPKPVAGSTSSGGDSAKNPTITIVNISDIFKMKEQQSQTKSASNSANSSVDDPLNPVNRKRPTRATESAANSNKKAKTVIDIDEIDFEDVLTTNILTADGKSKTALVNKIDPKNTSTPISNKTFSSNTKKPQQMNISKATPSTTTSRSAPIRPTSKPTITKSSTVAGIKNINNNTDFKTKNNGRLTSTTAKPQTTKPAPRILNSSLKSPPTIFNSKSPNNQADKHFSIDLTDNDDNVKLINTTKPNFPQPKLLNNTLNSSNSSLKILNKSPAALRNSNSNLSNKINTRTIQTIPTKPGNPKMKKITCFETWYVINIPNDENKPEKSVLNLSLIRLGNTIQEINLPSEHWSYKITLVKLRNPPKEHDEVYTGEIQEKNIKEEDKHKYEPFNIMFRRKSTEPSQFNVQYDRAVVFKNRAFFINIDGKNCKLVGAPQTINDLSEIQTLINIVDDIDLQNACVELTPYA